MSKSIENRIKKVQEKISPNKYRSIEDILWVLNNEKRGDLTVEEKRKIEELKSLPVEPGLHGSLQQIREKRGE